MLYLPEHLPSDVVDHLSTLCRVTPCGFLISSGSLESRKLAEFEGGMDSASYLECPVSHNHRLGPCKLVVGVSGEKHLQRLDSIKPARGDSSLNGFRCSLVIHTGMVM